MNPASGAPEGAGADLRRSVRQVVGAVAGYRGQQWQSCEELLSNLRLNDSNFHCYDLVRQLQSALTSELSHVLAWKLRGMQDHSTDWPSTAASITKEILESLQYRELQDSFTSRLRETVQEMLDDPAHLSLSHAHCYAPSSSLSTQYLSLDNSLSSGLSRLLDPSSLWSPSQLATITGDLTPSQPPEVRMEAMHHLLQFPVGDLVAMDTWAQLKTVLSETVMDSDPRIADMSLTLHSYLLTTLTPTSSLEAHSSLTHQLHTFFSGEEGVAVTMAMGIDPADDRSLTILQRMSLLNRFHREVPAYWVRYSCNTVQDIVSATFDLLLLGNDTPGQLRPLHYQCLLDPTAEWLGGWTHAEVGRSAVFESLTERPELLQDVVCCVMSCRPRRYHGNSLPKHNSGFYNEGSLRQLQFTHSLSVLGRLVRWERGRHLFPVTDRHTTYSISDVLVHLIHTLYSLPPPTVTSDPRGHAHHVTSLDPAHLILRLLQELASGSVGCHRLLTDDRVLSTLLSPLVPNEGAGPGVAMETLERVGQVVSQLASTDNGRSVLLGSEGHLQVLCAFVRDCLTTDTHPVPPVVMTTWLFACRQLYKTGAGLVAMEKYQLTTHIVHLITKVGIEEVRGQLGGCGYQLGRELVDNLLGVCWSSRGVGSLGSFPGILELCAEYMWDRMKQGPQMSWCDRHGYGSLMTQLASSFPGARALIRSGVVCGVVEMVRECEGEGGEEKLVTPWTHPLDTPDHALNKTLSSLFNILSSFPVMHELLNSDLSTSETTSMLMSWLLGNHTSQRSSLDRLIRTRVVSMVTTSLDTLILLEDKYGLSETLLRQQRAVAMENGCVALDETTVVTNRVIVAAGLIGGPSERSLPPLSPSLNPYPCPLVTDHPLPECFHGNTVALETQLETDSPLYKLVESGHAPSRDSEGAWLGDLREVFCEEVRERCALSNDLVAMVLEGVAKTRPQVTSSENVCVYSSASDAAINLIFRYGVKLGLLSPSHLTPLTSLLKPHPPDDRSSAHPGFDWLTAISFLLTRGHRERATPISQLLHSIIGPGALQETCHRVELVLQGEAPQLTAALQVSGCSVAQVVGHWTRQAFLNYLDWPHLLLYLATTVVMGTNYQAYWCVCYLRSKEAAILLHCQMGDLLPHLLEYPTPEFQPHQWLGYMRELDLRFT